jgi:CheY-like chemotaxis protein
MRLGWGTPLAFNPSSTIFSLGRKVQAKSDAPRPERVSDERGVYPSYQGETMEYLPLGLAGLLGGAYLVCSLAEFLLGLFERKPSAERGPTRRQAAGQEGRRLPARIAEDALPDAQEGSPVGTAKKPGILIAADHRLYRRMLQRWFCDHGFIVWVAADGREAVELHRAYAQDIGLALLDVCMPALDGPGTLVALRREAPTLPCCFMTASLTAKQEALLPAQGAAHVFEKPLLLREATALIWGFINQTGRDYRACGHTPGEQPSE